MSADNSDALKLLSSAGDYWIVNWKLVQKRKQSILKRHNFDIIG